jgi:hypothetical protein
MVSLKDELFLLMLAANEEATIEARCPQAKKRWDKKENRSGGSVTSASTTHLRRLLSRSDEIDDEESRSEQQNHAAQVAGERTRVDCRLTVSFSGGILLLLQPLGNVSLPLSA